MEFNLKNKLNLSNYQDEETKTAIDLIRNLSKEEDNKPCSNACLLLVWKLKRYKKKITTSSYFKIISDVLTKDKLEEIEKELKDNFKKITEKTLPSLFFDFLECKYSKSGDISSIKFNYYKFRAFLLDHYHIKKVNNILAFWNGTEYKLGTISLCNLIYQFKFLFELTSSFNEKDFIAKYIKRYTKNVEANDTQYIALQDHDLSICNAKPCLETLLIFTKNPSRIVTNALTISIGTEYTDELIEWVQKCKNYKKFQDYIKQITGSDNQKITRLAEILGNLLIRGTIVKEGALTFLVGQKSGGKSTLLNALQLILGIDNCCSINPNNFGERFDLQDALGKPVNLVHESISSEITEKAIAKLKSIVTDDTVTVESKYEPAISIRLHLKSIFACNYVPPIKWDDAFLYRIQIFPFESYFADSSFSKEICEDQDFLNSLFVYALEGCLRLMKNKKFSECKACDEALEHYKQLLSPINEFLLSEDIRTLLYTDHSGKYKHKSDYEQFTVLGMYKLFRNWADQNGYYNKNDFPNIRKFRETVLNTFPDLVIKKGSFYCDGNRSQDLVFSKKNETGEQK